MLEFQVGPAIDADLPMLASTEPVAPVEQFYKTSVNPRDRAAAVLFVGWAQTFTATSSFDLVRVQLPLGRGDGGNVTLRILGTTDAGEPDSGDVLGTASAAVSAGGDYSLVAFDFPAGLRLTAQDRYAVHAHGPNISWAGQLGSDPPAIELYAEPGGWQPFSPHCGMFFRLFDRTS